MKYWATCILATYIAAAATIVHSSEESAPVAADRLLPYLERCCSLGQEFARSRRSCDATRLEMAHRHRVAVSTDEGVSNITCTISATFCCEETLQREFQCHQGITAAMADATCSTQTNTMSKACCSWCKAGLVREPSACETLSADVPADLREAFTVCCQRTRSNRLRQTCGVVDCQSPNVTCVPPVELCAFDDDSCHYRCVESALSCQVGFKMDEAGRCVDVDECAQRSHSCAPNEICVNEYGSYSCKACSC